MRRGQASAEYKLVLIVAILVALAAFIILQPFTHIEKTQSHAYWESATPLSIVSYNIKGNFVYITLENRKSSRVRLTEVSLSGRPLNISPVIFSAGDRHTVTGILPSPCTEKSFSYDLVLTYDIISTKGTTITGNKFVGSKPLIGDCASSTLGFTIGNKVCEPGENSTITGDCYNLSGAGAAWYLNEGVGLLAYDSSGNNNTGNLSGAIVWVSGSGGTALNCTGSGYVLVPNSRSLNLSGTNITYEAWVKWNIVPANGTSQAVILDKGNGAHYTLTHSTSNQYFQCTIRNSTTVRSVTSITQPVRGRWYHVACTYDGEFLRIYVNGRLENNVTCSGALRPSTTAVNLCRLTGGTRYFNGVVDEVIIYNRTLSAAEIASHFYSRVDYSPGNRICEFGENSSITTDCYNETNASAIWYMNEESGARTFDSSGNNNVGTLTGTAAWETGKAGSGINCGSSGYISSPNSASLNITGNQITYEAFVKWNIPPSNGTSQAVILDKGNVAHYTLGHSANNTYFSCTIRNATHTISVNSTTSPIQGRWYHVACVYDGSTLRIYVNGNSERSVGASGMLRASTTSVSICRTTGGARYFNGVVDEVAIYSRALTAAEIGSHVSSRG